MRNNLKQWTHLNHTITARLNTLDEETVLKHHIHQFQILCEKAELCVRERQNDPEAELIKLLASQWKRLDNIASQYLTDSSKSTLLEESNTQACSYYSRMFRALPDRTSSNPVFSAPLFYFEDPSTDFAELTVFRERLPALIGIPEHSRSEIVIAYEVSRTFFEKIPGFLPELQARVQSQLPAVPQKIIEWLGDIAARLTGIALLFDVEKMKKHLLTPAEPKISQTVTHDVALLLPYIGLATLQCFLNHFLGDERLGNKTSEELIEQIKKDLDALLENRLNKPCEFISGSTDVSFQEAKDTLLSVVRLLCSDEMLLETLGGKSLFGS